LALAYAVPGRSRKRGSPYRRPPFVKTRDRHERTARQPGSPLVASLETASLLLQRRVAQDQSRTRTGQAARAVNRRVEGRRDAVQTAAGAGAALLKGQWQAAASLLHAGARRGAVAVDYANGAWGVRAAPVAPSTGCLSWWDSGGQRELSATRALAESDRRVLLRRHEQEFFLDGGDNLGTVLVVRVNALHLSVLWLALWGQDLAAHDVVYLVDDRLAVLIDGRTDALRLLGIHQLGAELVGTNRGSFFREAQVG